MATLDGNGICLITDANTDDYNLQLKIGGEWGNLQFKNIQYSSSLASMIVLNSFILIRF